MFAGLCWASDHHSVSLSVLSWDPRFYLPAPYRRPPFFGRVTWFEEAAVEREGWGQRRNEWTSKIGTLKQCLVGSLDFADWWGSMVYLQAPYRRP